MHNFYLRKLSCFFHPVRKTQLIILIILGIIIYGPGGGLNAQSGFIQINTDLHSRILYNHLGGATFQYGASSPIDSGGINFLLNLPSDNHTIELKVGLKFEDRDTNSIQQLQFDEAYIRVNNLFGFMDVKFFDIGYGAGWGNSIRPDLPAYGMQFYFRPIDALTVSLGYGIASTDLELFPVSNSQPQSTLNDEVTQYSPNYHALKFDLIYDNLYLPLEFYYGIALVDNASSYLNKDYLPVSIDDRILHTSLGLSLDLLGYYRKQAMVFDIGFGLPLGAMSRYVQIKENGEYNYDPEFNFLFQFYGDVDIAYGIGLEYHLLFALDTHTKQKTLGNLYDEYFKEAFKISFIPRYTYGPVSWDIGIEFGIIGGMTARNSYERKDSIVFNKASVYNNLITETGLEWTPFPFKNMGKDFTVRGYYKVDLGDLDDSGDHYHALGLQLKLSFNNLDLD